MQDAGNFAVYSCMHCGWGSLHSQHNSSQTSSTSRDSEHTEGIMPFPGGVQAEAA